MATSLQKRSFSLTSLREEGRGSTTQGLIGWVGSWNAQDAYTEPETMLTKQAVQESTRYDNPGPVSGPNTGPPD